MSGDPSRPLPHYTPQHPEYATYGQAADSDPEAFKPGSRHSTYNDDAAPMISIPAAQPTGLTSAQNIQHDWRNSQHRDDPIQVGMHHQPYSYPYEPSQSQPIQRKPSTISPWDSASQRDVPTDPVPPVPNYQTPEASRHLHNQSSFGGLSCIDEEGKYYRSDSRPTSMLLSNQSDDLEMRGLIDPEGSTQKRRDTMGQFDTAPYLYDDQGGGKGFDDYREPGRIYTWLLFPTGLDRLLGLFGMNKGQFPIQQAVERKRRGIPGQRFPIATWVLTAAMCAMMVYEIIRNNTLTAKPIALKPNFNYMIGPTAEVLINIGARFPPCMKLVDALPPTFQLACLNDTSSTPTTACSLEEICGHGGFPNGIPNQAWRFVYPIFLHVGIVHLLLNMVAQVLAGGQVEREMGTVPFLLVYIAGGIYGFVLGGNFSRPGVPSVGASGALFATNACVLVDLLLHWKYEERPKLKAFLLFVEFAIGFAIGYIPNAVDGLAHLGGWAMGILMGIILYPSISETKRHRYVVWGLRTIALPLIVLAFLLTIRNFYTDDPNAACEWCKYLSCMPTSSNDRCSGTGITVTQTTTTRRSWDL